MAKANLAASIFGVVLLFIHWRIRRIGVHDIRIVFTPARGQNKSPHNDQNQNNAQYHHFARPPSPREHTENRRLRFNAILAKLKSAMTRSLPSASQLDVSGYGYQAEELPPAGEAPRPEDDPRLWFGDPNRPFELEIGSGKGTFLVQEAPHRPEHNFLGIEWMMAFWRYAADRARRRGLQNVRMLHADAVAFVRQRVANESIHTFHLYFSDPWPKSRHHRRRVVQDSTLTEFHRVIEPGGTLRIVTDHDELWSWYEEHVDRCTLFEREPYEPCVSAKPGELVGSNFERKFIPEGRHFRGMTLRRKG